MVQVAPQECASVYTTALEHVVDDSVDLTARYCRCARAHAINFVSGSLGGDRRMQRKERVPVVMCIRRGCRAMKRFEKEMS